MCSQPLETGPCKAANSAFYYSANNNTCEPFIYGGCNGNSNRFSDAETCLETCGGKRFAKCIDACMHMFENYNHHCFVRRPVINSNSQQDNSICHWNNYYPTVIDAACNSYRFSLLQGTTVTDYALEWLLL